MLRILIHMNSKKRAHWISQPNLQADYAKKQSEILVFRREKETFA